MIDDLPETWSALVEQADDIITEGTTATELVSELDVTRYRRRDASGDKGRSTPFEPMFKAMVLQELEELSDTELREALEVPKVASALGFAPDEVPSRSTFTRARTDRFVDAAQLLARSTDQIHEIARERGSPIGPELEPEDGETTSARSKRRELRQKTIEVIGEMENVVFPSLNLPQEDAAVYDKDDLLMAETIAGISDDVGLNGAGDIYGDILDSEGELKASHPFYLDGPTGETVLRSVHQMDATEITEMVNRALRKEFMRVKPYDEFSEPVTVAIDATYIPYYGDREGMPRVTKVPQEHEKEYTWCHKYATLNIVGENTHFVLAMMPVGDPDHHDSERYPESKAKPHRPGSIVRNLLETVGEAISIDVVYADKEFFGADTVAAFEEHNLNYVLPIPASATRDLEAVNGKVTVKQEHAFTGAVRDGVSNERVVTTAVTLPPDDNQESEHSFATNLDVDDEIGADRRWTRQKIERYSLRGGIETAYSKIKEFCGMTTSHDFKVRLFHFGMATLLYNMWLLVDFLVQRSTAGEVKSKPQITAERFRWFVERLLHQLRPG